MQARQKLVSRINVPEPQSESCASSKKRQDYHDPKIRQDGFYCAADKPPTPR